MSVMIPAKVTLTATDDSEVVTSDFQLLQWKFALKLELKGMTMSRGQKVSTHLRKLLKLKRSFTIQQLLDYVVEVLAQVEEAKKS